MVVVVIGDHRVRANGYNPYTLSLLRDSVPAAVQDLVVDLHPRTNKQTATRTNHHKQYKLKKHNRCRLRFDVVGPSTIQVFQFPNDPRQNLRVSGWEALHILQNYNAGQSHSQELHDIDDHLPTLDSDAFVLPCGRESRAGEACNVEVRRAQPCNCSLVVSARHIREPLSFRVQTSPMMLPILFHVGIAVRRCEDLLDMTINDYWRKKQRQQTHGKHINDHEKTKTTNLEWHAQPCKSMQRRIKA